MAPEQCQHFKRVSSVVRLDFSRSDNPDGPTYSGSVAAGICEECGQVELYANLHNLLCEWLRRS